MRLRCEGSYWWFWVNCGEAFFAFMEDCRWRRFRKMATIFGTPIFQIMTKIMAPLMLSCTVGSYQKAQCKKCFSGWQDDKESSQRLRYRYLALFFDTVTLFRTYGVYLTLRIHKPLTRYFVWSSISLQHTICVFFGRRREYRNREKLWSTQKWDLRLICGWAKEFPWLVHWKVYLFFLLSELS